MTKFRSCEAAETAFLLIGALVVLCLSLACWTVAAAGSHGGRRRTNQASVPCQRAFQRSQQWVRVLTRARRLERRRPGAIWVQMCRVAETFGAMLSCFKAHTQI
eukprot:3859837-Pleurochrysis_carterae.AAC.4